MARAAAERDPGRARRSPPAVSSVRSPPACSTTARSWPRGGRSNRPDRARCSASRASSSSAISDSGMAGEATNSAPGAFAAAPVEEAAERLAAILREEDAEVLTIYDENGNYGHPDHIQVHRVGMRGRRARRHIPGLRGDREPRPRARPHAGAGPTEMRDIEDAPDPDDFNIGVAGRPRSPRRSTSAPSSTRSGRPCRRTRARSPRTPSSCSSADEAFKAVFGFEWFIRRRPEVPTRRDLALRLRGEELVFVALTPGGTMRRHRKVVAVTGRGRRPAGHQRCRGTPTAGAAERKPTAVFAKAGPYTVGVETVTIGDRKAEVWYPTSRKAGARQDDGRRTTSRSTSPRACRTSSLEGEHRGAVHDRRVPRRAAGREGTVPARALQPRVQRLPRAVVVPDDAPRVVGLRRDGARLPRARPRRRSSAARLR